MTPPVPVGPTAVQPSVTPWSTSPSTDMQKVVAVSLGVRGSAQTRPDVLAGITIAVEADFNPVVQVLTRRADGSVLSSSTTNWEDAPLAQMRYCLNANPQPCELGQWQPYQPQITQEITVDWLGPRQYNLLVEFADAAGMSIPSVRSYYYDAMPQTGVTLTVTSALGPGTPLAQLPPPVQTAAASTQTAYPVTGSVQIEGGRCCAGGKAGSIIELKVDFQADSRAGEITEMKVQVGQCITEPDQFTASWEPYQPQQTFETLLAINWVGWWISVQYRDSSGNLSPVYCDDISLEGSP